MKLLNHELKLSISLDEKTCVNAKAFSAAGYEAAECDLPVDYFAPVDLSIFPPFLEKVCPAIEEAGLRITTFHLPFPEHSASLVGRPSGTAAVAASAELLQDARALCGREHRRPSQRRAHRRGGARGAHRRLPEESRGAGAHRGEMRKEDRAGEPAANLSGPHVGGNGASDGRRRAVRRLHGHDPHVPRNAPAVHAALESGSSTPICQIISVGQNECHWVPGTGSLNWKRSSEPTD